MAKATILFQNIKEWEGGWSDHKNDKGGKTNMGITLKTWKSCGYDKDGDGIIDERDLKLINEQDVFNVFKKHYWNRYRGDDIRNQSIANIVVDWLWMSGNHAIINVQKLLSIKADGVVGPITINTINQANQRELFAQIKRIRKEFFEKVSRDNPTQNVFLKGWLRRLDSYVYAD